MTGPNVLYQLMLVLFYGPIVLSIIGVIVVAVVALAYARAEDEETQ